MESSVFLKAYNEKFIRQPRKAASVVFPLHKSPISEIIIHLGEKEKTQEAAREENQSECIRSVCIYAACWEQHLLQFGPVLIFISHLFRYAQAERLRLTVYTVWWIIITNVSNQRIRTALVSNEFNTVMMISGGWSTLLSKQKILCLK